MTQFNETTEKQLNEEYPEQTMNRLNYRSAYRLGRNSAKASLILACETLQALSNEGVDCREIIDRIKANFDWPLEE